MTGVQNAQNALYSTHDKLNPGQSAGHETDKQTMRVTVAWMQVYGCCTQCADGADTGWAQTAFSVGQSQQHGVHGSTLSHQSLCEFGTVHLRGLKTDHDPCRHRPNWIIFKAPYKTVRICLCSQWHGPAEPAH